MEVDLYAPAERGRGRLMASGPLDVHRWADERCDELSEAVTQVPDTLVVAGLPGGPVTSTGTDDTVVDTPPSVSSHYWTERPRSGYLADAATAGTLFRHAGLPFVADNWTDDITGITKGYVEWADPRLLADGQRRQLAAAAANALDNNAIILRVPAATPANRELRYRARYVHLGSEDHLPSPTPSDIRVRPPRRAELPAVYDWLIRAHQDAYSGLREPAADEIRLAQTVREIYPLESAEYEVRVALKNDRLIGHATCLRDQEDNLTGIRYDELIDILVDPGGEVASQAHSALLAALDVSRTPNKPMLGNVTYDSTNAANVYTALLKVGWRPAYDLQEWTPAD